MCCSVSSSKLGGAVAGHSARTCTQLVVEQTSEALATVHSSAAESIRSAAPACGRLHGPRSEPRISGFARAQNQLRRPKYRVLPNLTPKQSFAGRPLQCGYAFHALSHWLGPAQTYFNVFLQDVSV